jgi:hypothetical protein
VIVIAASAGQAQAAKKRVKPPAVDPLPSPSVYSWGAAFTSALTPERPGDLLIGDIDQ